MEKKQAIAIGIALQTQVLKTCPVHRQLYFDDDVNPASAFALAIELVRKHKPYVEVFDNNEHELTDLLSRDPHSVYYGADGRVERVCADVSPLTHPTDVLADLR